MKHITIVVPEGENNLSSIAGAYHILTRANTYWQQRHHEPRLCVELAGVSETNGFHDGLFSVRPHRHLQEITSTNLILIPSVNHRFEEALADNRQLTDWIRAHYSRGAEVASICTGAFLLAQTGLLDGKSCSTHWSFAAPFREMFPAVKLQTDLLITDECGLYTNGGAFSFLNLLLYLIEKYCDRQTAIYCSKVFQIEPDRHSQAPFMLFTGQQSHNDEVIRQAQLYIEHNLQARISISELSSRYALGRRTFDRRFQKATGNSPVEYLQRVRIEAAKKAFESGAKQVSEVMYDVGYTDAKAFREVFRKITGLSPLDYRQKYTSFHRNMLER